RSTWHRDVWAIMYAWYLPKGYEKPRGNSANNGHRHFWGYATVWIDNPAMENAKIVGVSMPGLNYESYEYEREAPVDPKHLDGSSVKLKFHAVPSEFGRGKQGLWPVEDAGEFQDLICWNQLTEAARQTLSTYHFSFTNDMSTFPLKDDVFPRLLNATWPF
ncbi:Necrosis inducing protein NPP1, partial [Phytophthora megakarya]